MKRKWILLVEVVLVFILLLFLGLYVAKNGKKEVEYEYYTKNDEKGISHLCIETIDDLRCKIQGELVEVKQYSIMEENK